MEGDKGLGASPDAEMRDPGALVSFEDSVVLRKLAAPLDEGHFLTSDLARSFVETRLLTPFVVVDARTVTAPRLPFVTYPFEWCDSQLLRAAELTLHIQQECVSAGYDLKDASAWNVIYAGTRPVFCDLLSFVPLRTKKWWAMGQFARQFVVPLAVARRRGLRVHHAFKAWRDGIPADVGRQLLGPSRFLSRYWPLVAGDAGSAIRGTRDGSNAQVEPGEISIDSIRNFRVGLHTVLRWTLKGAAPVTSMARRASREWDQYEAHREHYLADSLDHKRACVSAWVGKVMPAWVADFGCNTGEFSEIALKHGASVVALDADHESVQRLFDRFRDNAKLFPVLANLDDVSGGRGWAGVEYASLPDRMAQRFDLVMMLALIHHLMVSVSIPMEVIAAFCARCTRSWLIVELIDESDPQLRLLCAQRLRDPGEFTLQRQRDAFAHAGFDVHEEVSLTPAARSLVLLRLRS